MLRALHRLKKEFHQIKITTVIEFHKTKIIPKTSLFHWWLLAVLVYYGVHTTTYICICTYPNVFQSAVIALTDAQLRAIVYRYGGRACCLNGSGENELLLLLLTERVQPNSNRRSKYKIFGAKFEEKKNMRF